MKYCEQYAALLDLFVDGELSLEEMLEVQAHLDECPTCRAYVDDALTMRAAFPDAEHTEVPEGFAAGVMAAIQADSTARPASPRKKKKTPWAGVVASLAACCAIVIVQQFGPMTTKSESTAASMGYDAVVAEEAGCEDTESASLFTSTTNTAESAPMEPAAEARESSPAPAAENDSVSPLLADAAAEEETGSAAPKASSDSVPADHWVENGNVIFACVVFLPQDRAGDALAGYEGKPYVTEEGIVGTGYALSLPEFEQILYDAFDYPHGPELDPERTTDLCCIVITE